MRFLCVFVLVLFSALPGSAQLKTMYPHGRLDPALAQKWERRQLSDSLTVSLSLRSTGRLHQPGFPARVLQHYDRYPIVYARVAARDLLWLATDTALSFIQEYHAPREELTTGAFDPTLNRIRFAQHRYPGLSGAGLNVLVKERRLDTADIDLRQRIVRTGREAAEQTSHASLMATIIAGAGNSSPFARGAAPGAGVGSVSFTHLLPEPDTLMQRLRFPVTNHSYGTVPESFYGNEAAAYDRQVHTFPQQLHVFSAGNAGSATISSGPYAGLPGASTLTGNFKSAKNVLVVGAVDSLGEPMDGSSRGPAHDGRLKPELVAFGEDGSSGAAAAVSGIALLVQDAYRQRHGDSLPPAALVKAVLVTTAADAGIPGPDYITGHGRADAEKAVRLMLEGSHFTGTISAGQTARHLLPIPSGTGRLRATLAWTDPPAQPGASRALVHDLDLRLIAEGTGTAWLPWVLSGNREEWTKGAERKRDTLNNLEHISLEGPASGTYAVEITAPASVTGLQEYTVAFFREAADTGYFIFPTASDPLQAGRTHLVRWECSAPGTATLEVAVNGGAWETIASVPAAQGFYRWAVPDTQATAVFRLALPSAGPVLSDTFVVAPLPELKAGFSCPESFLLHWNGTPGRTYELYRLDGAYLQPFQQTTDTVFL
ncbi:MAG TPA: S8 family serine peptidase, partial [Chitinophagaceae bacterium]|nr:S8 family serine peptidase [Chitinophagaceae bacterium]